MITEMRSHLVEDISQPNAVLSVGVNPSLLLAAAVWTASSYDSVVKARLSCLKYAAAKLSSIRPNWQLWLVAGNRTLQPDNRIIRHLGLWKTLNRRGVSLPTGEYLEESVQQSEGSLRFFGAVRFEVGQLECVHAVMMAESAAIIAIDAQARSLVSEIVRQGWVMNNTKPPEEVLEAVCHNSGLVLDVYGEFDDPDVVVAAIGKKDVVVELNG